jgi:diguanylate cyclase (GGDEF)-like protein
MPEPSQLFFSHELRVALWYLLEEELPPAEPNWMGGEIGGDGQRLLEQSLRKDLNKLHLASGGQVAEILRNFVVMLAKPRELLVLLETMPSVFFAGARGLGVGERERTERLEMLKRRILGKLDDFNLPMMFTEQTKLVPRTVDAVPAVLSKLPRAEDLLHRLQPLINSHPVVSLVFADVDGLKAVNDRLGHDTGTTCLAKFVEVMSGIVVGRGSMFRYGGDEFIVVLPNFDGAEAAATAERLRRAVEGAAIGDPQMTASVGVASSADERVALSLINKADEAAYASKFSGKNRVTQWPLDVALAERLSEVRKAAPGR